MPRYGEFESYATRYTDTEAWCLIAGDWRRFFPGEVRAGVRNLSAAKYEEIFGRVPSLPKEAFTGQPMD